MYLVFGIFFNIKQNYLGNPVLDFSYMINFQILNIISFSLDYQEKCKLNDEIRNESHLSKC
jgi:hypothetical protein